MGLLQHFLKPKDSSKISSFQGSIYTNACFANANSSIEKVPTPNV